MSGNNRHRFDCEQSAQPVPVYIAPEPFHEDRLTLMHLWQRIVSHKIVFILSILATMGGVLGYLEAQTPVYVAEAHLMPPTQRDVQGLRIIYSDEDVDSHRKFTPIYVYEAFLSEFISPGTKRAFFGEANQIESDLTSAEERVDSDRLINVEYNVGRNGQPAVVDQPLVTVTLTGSRPGQVASQLNRYIEFANRRTVERLVRDVNSEIQAHIRFLRYEVDSKLKLAEQNRIDTVTSLKESLHIAKKLGIKSISVFSGQRDQVQPELVINTARLPAYMRGSDALETEIEALESRKSDEAFAVGLRKIQERLALFEGIILDPDALSAVTVNAPAIPPVSRSDHSRMMMIVLVGMVFAVLLGIVAVLLVGSSTRDRPESG